MRIVNGKTVGSEARSASMQLVTPLLALRAPECDSLRRKFALAFLIVLFAGRVDSAIAADNGLTDRVTELRFGMTADEVVKRLNNLKPERVSRQIVYRRHSEQWYYDNGNIRLQFDARPSEEPKLTGIFQVGKRDKP